MDTSPSQFIWYELMTTDMDAAESFYTAVVGWTAQRMDAQRVDRIGFRYTLMSAGDKMVAGVMGLPPEAAAAGARPGWLGYIHSSDVDARTQSVRQAGGTVHREPADIPDIGRFSVVADPQGATFVLFAPAGSDEQPAPYGTPGTVGWHELYAADGQAAFDFYSEQFGWTKDGAMDMGPMGTYQFFAAGAGMIGAMMNKPAEVPAPVWQFYFIVDAIDAAVARITDKGGTITMPPMEVPGGQWIVLGLDPQGASFALVAPRR